MNPVAYALEPNETIYFLLVGTARQYIGNVKPPDRLWSLNVYSSAKSRTTNAKKLKRLDTDTIFVEWEITMEQIVKQGKMVFPLASEKVLRSDKVDILRQLIRHRA
jgi:hypothetical protein